MSRLFHPSFQPDVSPCQPRLKTLFSLPKNKTPEYLRCSFSPVSRCASLCLRCCHVSSGGPLSVHMFILQSLWQRLRINTWEGDGLHVLRILLISFHRRHSSLAEERRVSESKKKNTYCWALLQMLQTRTDSLPESGEQILLYVCQNTSETLTFCRRD